MGRVQPRAVGGVTGKIRGFFLPQPASWPGTPFAALRMTVQKVMVTGRNWRWHGLNTGGLPAPASKLAGDPVLSAQIDNFKKWRLRVDSIMTVLRFSTGLGN